ncbi:MAG TPA: glycoside hydrolase family 3 C-terminal domain-containing protein [Bryobacteraceae bacterium]|nr:glycoside hydrolase family 3 C-terminal domain-containing protein [Bryobacteraceae bacterium]
MMNKPTAALILVSTAAWLAMAQGAAPALPQLPGISAGDCKPAGEKAWTNADQTPVCRALEALAQMTFEEKLNFRGSLPRLGLNAGPGGDGPHGVAGRVRPGQAPPPGALGVTAFPNEHLLAATWDKNLAARVGKAMGEEFAGKGLAFDYGPTINLARTWHWGRTAETFGEDPYLTAEMAVPEISALQGQHVISVLKHYVANNQDIDRQTIDEKIPERALHEIYLHAWKQVVERARLAGAFCAFNGVNGFPSCMNQDLLGTLRGWGFDGFVMPEPVRDAVAAAKAGSDRLAPAVIGAAVKSGKLDASTVDLIAFHQLVPYFRLGIYDAPMGSPAANVSTPEHQKLAEEVAEQGAVLLKNKGAVLPLRQIRTLAIVGEDAGENASLQQTNSAVYIEKPSIPVNAITQRAGGGIRVNYVPGNAVIGPLAEMQSHFTATFYPGSDISGSPAGNRTDDAVDLAKFPPPAQFVPAPPPGGGRGRGPAAPRIPWSARWTATLTPQATGRYRFSLTGSGTAHLYVDSRLVATIMKSDAAITVIGAENLTASKPVEVKLEYMTQGRAANLRLGMQTPDSGAVAAVQKAAKEADVAVVFAGERAGEGMDRWSLTLPGDLDNVIETVAAANPHTVVVLNTAGAVAMPWIDKVAGVIWAGHPGAFDGSSIAALLFGDANPSGKLTMTFPVNEQQGPATKPDEYPGDGKVVNYSEGLLVGYRWFDAKNQTPLFPFGYGLSYTTFKYSDLKVESGADGQRTVKVKVTNSGKREGAEVVELYLGDPAAAGEPPKQLKGFEKVRLKPGESKQVSMALNRDTMSVWDDATHGWKVVPGEYSVSVGSSSRDIRLRGSFTVR